MGDDEKTEKDSKPKRKPDNEYTDFPMMHQMEHIGKPPAIDFEKLKEKDEDEEK